jgi:hypothetical protein
MRSIVIIFLAVTWCGIACGQDSLNVTRVGQVSLPSGSGWESVSIVGNNAYVANGPNGFRVIDVSDPFAPVEIGFYDSPGYAGDLAIAGNYACVADGFIGLHIVNIADPAQPVEAGLYDTPGAACGVAVAGNLAYVADWESGLRVVDFTDPADPFSIGSCNVPGYAHDVVLAGNYAYVAAEESGLQIFDITDPAAPLRVGHYDTDGCVLNVAVVGEIAYVADWNKGLRILDVTNPAVPSFISVFDSVFVQEVTVEGDFAHIVDPGSGLHVLNISDPANPTRVGFYNTPGGARGVTVSGSYTYVADFGYFGIYDCSAALGASPRQEAVAAQFELHPAYPNPFNATTQIRFDLPRTAFVTMNVYDLTGRLVETLASRTYEAGTHSVAFNSENRGSGTYVVRMNSGDFAFSQKVMLLK